MSVPTDLRYTREHEWVKVMDVKARLARVGITDHAQREMGDIVYIELPEAGATLSMQDAFGSIESVKAVSELYSPVSGRVSQVNPTATDDPETVNQDPYGDGWLIEITMSSPSEVNELLTAAQYDELLAEED